MEKYGIDEDTVRTALLEPDGVLEGHSGRHIAQMRLNGYVLRVIYEKVNDDVAVITVYPARRDRYEI